MKSFLATRIRNVAIIKIAIICAVVVGSLGAVFMVFSLILSAVFAPVEAVQNAVSSFFGGEDSADSDDVQAVNLQACLPINAVALEEVVETVPPRTDVETAWAWIAWRSQEIANGTDPAAYDSIIAFANSTAGQMVTQTVDTDPATISETYTSSAQTGYTLAAITGIVDLTQRGILTAADDDTVTELSAVLADQCSS